MGVRGELSRHPVWSQNPPVFSPFVCVLSGLLGHCIPDLPVYCCCRFRDLDASLSGLSMRVYP